MYSKQSNVNLGKGEIKRLVSNCRAREFSSDKMVNDPYSFLHYLSSSEYIGQKNSDLNGDLNPDFYDLGASLCQLSYQANWELLIMWVDYKQVEDRHY